MIRFAQRCANMKRARYWSAGTTLFAATFFCVSPLAHARLAGLVKITSATMTLFPGGGQWHPVNGVINCGDCGRNTGVFTLGIRGLTTADRVTLAYAPPVVGAPGSSCNPGQFGQRDWGCSDHTLTATVSSSRMLMARFTLGRLPCGANAGIEATLKHDHTIVRRSWKIFLGCGD